MTEVNEVCSMGLTFDPGECLSPRLFHFAVPVTMDAFSFVDFSFLSLFFQEAVKAAGICVSVNLYGYLGNTVLKPWHQLCKDGALFLSTACYKILEGLSYNWLRYYQPHFKQYGVQAC